MEYVKDPVTRFISIIVPATVAECTRHSFNSKRDNLNTFTEKISGNIMVECNFDIESDDDTADVTSDASNATTNELSHIQNLKLDLHELFNDIKREWMEELRDTLKLELKMELFMELESIKAQLSTQVKPASSASTQSITAASGSLPQFKSKLSSSSAIAPITGGFESIKNKVTFDSASKKVEYDLLANNPLFAQVSKNIERIQQGKSAYTAEELADARENRFGLDARSAFLYNANTYIEDDDDDCANEDIWDKMLKEKLKSQ